MGSLVTDLISVDLLAEDEAHETFLMRLVRRIAGDLGITLDPDVISARGGHGSAMTGLKAYVRLRQFSSFADVVIVAIDGNCSYSTRRREIEGAAGKSLRDQLVIACPDPHIERWYLADPVSFVEVIGHPVAVGSEKCVRDHYKKIVTDAIISAGHPPSHLDGVEYADDLAKEMNLYRAGKNVRSLHTFVKDFRNRLKVLTG